MGKKSGLGSLLTGMALGAAAVFFSKKENRDQTKAKAKRAASSAKTAVRKAKTKGKKIKSEVKKDAKTIKRIAKSKK